MTTILNASSSAGLVAQADTSAILQLQTANTAALTIDTSANVGIGTASPTSKLTVTGTSTAPTTWNYTGGASLAVYLSSSSSSISGIGDTAQNNLFAVNASSNYAIVQTNGSERMRIDSSGNLLIGTTTKDQYALMAAKGTGTNFGFGPSVSGVVDAFRVERQSDSTGVYLLAGGSSWTSNSDERLKDIIEPITGAINKVNGLRSVIGKWKSDEKETRRAFLIAQDVVKEFPEAAETSDPNKLGVQYTDVIPLLVASIKELNAKVDAQAAEIQALKGAK